MRCGVWDVDARGPVPDPAAALELAAERLSSDDGEELAQTPASVFWPAVRDRVSGMMQR